MKLFYGEINKTEVIIHEDEQQHITKVLRMKEGEEIFITNGKGSLAINIDKIQRQSIAASKQSVRFHFPIINDLTKFSDFVKNINHGQTFVAHCDKSFNRIDLKQIPLNSNLTFLIGPEGDFSPKEIQILTEKNIKAVTLGNQRLRTETAGIFISAWNYSNIS